MEIEAALLRRLERLERTLKEAAAAIEDIKRALGYEDPVCYEWERDDG